MAIDKAAEAGDRAERMQVVVQASKVALARPRVAAQPWAVCRRARGRGSAMP